ncbi:AI-2E family transporter [Corynebacterium marinum]|uniref:Permease n=1 Tax=Corynebacterium marinum DSM 44953 TaxID=1224162 RepID=A0A0B6TUE2_9CORY|nr:AI-2E family transporter [Corynebacterium marinum]AJK69849.1 permease [Corynebacterium marinum DSM 44953]GGO19077.1 permease [Corynebacterium marinum]
MSTSTDPHEPGETGTDTRDFAETVSDYAELSDNPQDVTNRQDDDDVTDRAVFIGRDGRWAAGWALRFIIFVAATYILGRILGFIWAGILPIVLALLVATVLWPPTKLLRDKLKFAPALATVVVLVGFFAVIGGIFAAMAPIVRNQGADLVEQAAAGIRQVSERIQGPPFNVDLGEFDGVLNDLTGYLQDQSSQIASGVFTGLSAATSVVVTLVVMLVLTFFFLKDGDKFLPWLRKYTGANAGWHLTEVLTRSWNTLAGFIRTQAIVSFVDATFIGIGLLLLGVPLAFVLAVITFFAGFIPIVGAFTAGALAVIIALVTNGVTNALFVLLLIIAVQQIEGNILQPVLQSKAMNLHAAVVLLSVTLGSTLFGIVGAFLAVPVAAVGAVWFRYHSELVALRAGEITIDDIEIATAKGSTLTSWEAFTAVREKLISVGRRKSEAGQKEEDAAVDEDSGAESGYRTVASTRPE